MGFFSSIKRLFTGSESPPQLSTPVADVADIAELAAPLDPEVPKLAPQLEAPADASLLTSNDVSTIVPALVPIPEIPPQIETVPTPLKATPETTPAIAPATTPATTPATAPATAPAVAPHAALKNVSATTASITIDSAALTLRLREAEPRLSVWLSLALEGVEQAGLELWMRVRFLLQALGAPHDEIESFVDDVSDWVTRMEYTRVADFRSELQYRLALALELEDEEDERSRLFVKLSDGLARTRAQLGKSLSTLFAAHGELTPAFWEELEEVFIMADMGVEAAGLLCTRLKTRAREAGTTTPDALSPLLGAELENIFRIPRRVVAVNSPEIVLMIGVNGVGKTTTIAKLAYRARSQGKKVMLAAGDTFRAAAVEQLGIWAERTGALFHAKGQDADPAAVAWEAVDKALAEHVDILFVDTAGRLHTKTNLMDELKKVRATLAKKHPGAPHRTVLILDATTGQNALSQVKLFKEAVGIDEIVLTKLDGTAKGGVAVAVALQFGIPITFVGLGEKMEDLRPFDGDNFAKALLGHAADAPAASS